jgi:hypothetical protein
MSDLYIANVTKQDYEFSYRIPESKKLHRIIIAPGTQTMLRHDPAAVAYIIDQHQKYGIISVADLEAGKTFNGLIYRIDKPLNIDSILRAIKRNDQALLKDGEKRRVDVANAANHLMARQAQEMDNRLSGLQIDVIEQAKDVNTPPEDRNHTSIRIDNDNGTVAAKKARRARGTTALQ